MINRVLGMGTAAMDTVFSCNTLPKADAFELLQKEQLMSGGSCANMLVTLTGLGIQTGQIAKIGDDSYGQIYRRELAAAGVDDSYVITQEGGTTLHTFILAAADGQHCIYANVGNSLMNWTADEVKPEMVEGVDLFYTDLFPAIPSIELAKLCKARGGRVITCMQCPPLFMEQVGVSREQLLEMIGLSDLVISGRDGYLQLVPEAPDYVTALKVFERRYMPTVGAVCTAGDQGAVWARGEQFYQASAYPVTAIDSTGAGDCFMSGLIYSYFHLGETEQQALDFAAALGALKCTVFGPRLQVKPEAVREFMQQYK